MRWSAASYVYKRKVRLTLFTRAFGLLGRVLAPAFGNRRWGFGMRQQLMVVAGLAADDLAGLRR